MALNGNLAPLENKTVAPLRLAALGSGRDDGVFGQMRYSLLGAYLFSRTTLLSYTIDYLIIT
jgi:hypothetical protein